MTAQPMTALEIIHRARLIQWRHPIRSHRPRRCCGCKWLIRPGLRHASALVVGRSGRVSDRRIHVECLSPEQVARAREELLETLNAAVGAVATVAAGGAVMALIYLLATH